LEIFLYEIFIKKMHFLLLIIKKKCQLNDPFEILPIYFWKGFEYNPAFRELKVDFKRLIKQVNKPLQRFSGNITTSLTIEIVDFQIPKKQKKQNKM